MDPTQPDLPMTENFVTQPDPTRPMDGPDLCPTLVQLHFSSYRRRRECLKLLVSVKTILKFIHERAARNIGSTYMRCNDRRLAGRLTILLLWE